MKINWWKLFFKEYFGTAKMKFFGHTPCTFVYLGTFLDDQFLQYMFWKFWCQYIVDIVNSNFNYSILGRCEMYPCWFLKPAEFYGIKKVWKITISAKPVGRPRQTLNDKRGNIFWQKIHLKVYSCANISTRVIPFFQSNC